MTYALAPPSDNGFIGAINGLMQGVYAYAGAQLFVEFMAELYRPRDFLKAMWGAQFFIYTCYMVYGSYVYYWQGQYAYNVSLKHPSFVFPFQFDSNGKYIKMIAQFVCLVFGGCENVFPLILSTKSSLSFRRSPTKVSHRMRGKRCAT